MSTGLDRPCPAYRAARKAAGAVLGVSVGLSRLLVAGCAGGAQGVVQAACPERQDRPSLLFWGTMGANLALSGALAGLAGSLAALALTPAQGILGGAAGNLMAGVGLWNKAPSEFQSSVKGAADRWVQAALGQSTGIGLATPLRVAVGEAVGAAAGVYVGATRLPAELRSQFVEGQRLFDRVCGWVCPPQEEARHGAPVERNPGL